MPPDVAPSRFDSALEYFTGDDRWSNSTYTAEGPGAATVASLARVVIPFAHYLRTAMIGANDIQESNIGATLDAKLMGSAPGASGSGTQIGSTLVKGTDFAAAVGQTTSKAFVMATVDTSALRAAGTTYCVQLHGVGAGDMWGFPVLTVGVEPAARSRL